VLSAGLPVTSQGLPSIVGVAVSGSTILAAASEPWNQTTPGGLYRSDNGGTFQAVAFGAGGGTVAVTSLAADRSQNNFFAVVLSTNPAQNGVWFSGNNCCQTWAPVLSLSTGQTARLATGPNGSVVAGIYDKFFDTCGTTSGQLQKLQRFAGVLPGCRS
jgi:hypothetical protein